MKVYISVDMEGIAGISHPNPTGRGDSGYPDAVRLMEGEANAAVLGAFDGGATDVTINDSHGSDPKPWRLTVSAQTAAVEGGSGTTEV